jgi:hypothetical protein
MVGGDSRSSEGRPSDDGKPDCTAFGDVLLEEACGRESLTSGVVAAVDAAVTVEGGADGWLAGVRLPLGV